MRRRYGTYLHIVRKRHTLNTTVQVFGVVIVVFFTMNRRSIVTRAPTTSLFAIKHEKERGLPFRDSTRIIGRIDTREINELIHLVKSLKLYLWNSIPVARLNCDGRLAASNSHAGAATTTSTTTFDMSRITQHPMFASLASAVPGLSKSNLIHVLQTVLHQIY
jgi:hypothetical protein